MMKIKYYPEILIDEKILSELITDPLTKKTLQLTKRIYWEASARIYQCQEQDGKHDTPNNPDLVVEGSLAVFEADSDFTLDREGFIESKKVAHQKVYDNAVTHTKALLAGLGVES